jgi:hypothetical protein
MNRYEDITNIIREESGVRRFSTTYYYKIPFKTSDFFIYAKSGDRLDLLANDYYGDPRYWWIIANENDIGKGTIIPPVGIRLRIPYPLNMLELENLKKEAINGTPF